MHSSFKNIPAYETNQEPSLGPFRSLTDIPSVFSGEVFALLSLATFSYRAMMGTRESLIGATE